MKPKDEGIEDFVFDASFDPEKAQTKTMLLISKAQGARLSGDAIKTQITEAVTAAVEEKIKPLGERLDSIESGKKDEPGAKDEPEKDPGQGGELAKTLAALNDKIDKLTHEREGDVKSRTAQDTIARVMKTKFPNLREVDREKLAARAVSEGIADEDAAIKLVGTYRDELKAVGVTDTDKRFGADPASEGASEPVDDAEQKQKEQIERIRNQKPLVRTVS